MYNRNVADFFTFHVDLCVYLVESFKTLEFVRYSSDDDSFKALDNTNPKHIIIVI